MTKLFQIMTAALLGLALIVPAAAQEGKRPKGERGKPRVDITSDRKGSDQRPRGNGDQRPRGNGNNSDRERDPNRPRNRPNDDLQDDL